MGGKRLMKKVLVGLFAVMSVVAFAKGRPGGGHDEGHGDSNNSCVGKDCVIVGEWEENKVDTSIPVYAFVQEPISVKCKDTIVLKAVRKNQQTSKSATAEIKINGPENQDIYVYHSGDDKLKHTYIKEYKVKGGIDRFTHVLHPSKVKGKLQGNTSNNIRNQREVSHFLTTTFDIAGIGAGTKNYSHDVNITVATKY